MDQRVCSPATGTWHYASLSAVIDGVIDSEHSSLDQHEELRTALQNCSWSPATVTNIPDAPSRSCTSALPDGETYLVNTPVDHPVPHSKAARDPLVISIAADGKNFSRHWAIRSLATEPQTAHCRYATDCSPGWQYPAAMWTRRPGAAGGGEHLLVSYSINK